MSYTVLARRYRSSTFDEVIGQDHVAQTLKKAIESGRIAHAYLFCGTRGVGKTSMARILAKALNCQKADGPTATPCGKCASCVAIARGDDMDVIEIDAASNTGVDNIRELIENSQYRPAVSRFKVYIIDEVHMLSKSAFNALLKTLEEPPSHVKFILATTEAEKVLPTILSRCQRYDFRNIPSREIAGHLADICKKEKIKADEDALLMVAKAGAGSMRDSLSLLDRLLSVGEKHLTLENIEQLLGLPKAQLLFDLADAIGSGDVKAVLVQVDSMVQGGLSVDGLIVALVDHLRNLLIVRTCGKDSTLVEVPGLSTDDLAAQAQKFDPVALTQDLTILEELRRHIRQSQAGRALLDATLVRITLADQFASIGELLSRLDGNGSPPRAATGGRSSTPSAGSAQKKNDTVSAPSASRTRAASTTVEAPVEYAPAASRAVEATSEVAVAESLAASAESQVATATVAEDEDDDLPAPGKVWSSGPAVSLSTLMARKSPPAPVIKAIPAPAPQTANIEVVDASDLPGVWRAFLALAMTHGPMLHSLLSQGQLASLEDGMAVIRFASQHETFVRTWERNGKKELFRETLCTVLNQRVGVKFEVIGDEAAAPAPAQNLKSQISNESPRIAPQVEPRPRPVPPPAPETAAIRITPELVDSLRESEPLVKELMDRLGAQVIKVE
ncbi:MAG TPA: DNA polymerase III subunit gamma/tau [Humisphaera sp.]|jgi:DNA polymerase-3 subunit gamma/tau|nr:DNA polymerase III subunit gamma/tau [Humisphaera sp.]